MPPPARAAPDSLAAAATLRTPLSSSAAAVVAIAAVVLIVLAAAMLAPAAVLALAARFGHGAPTPQMFEGLLVAAVSLATILPTLLLARLLHQPVASGRGTAAIAAALPAGAIGFGVALALSWAAGAVAPAPPRPLDPGLFVAGWLLTALAAFAEELLFRGLLQPVLAHAWGIAAALVLQAGMFALAHYVGGWRDPLSLANIALAALWLGLLAHATGGIAAPFLAHAAWNGTESLLFGASPNPGPGSFGSIADVDIVGPAWLGGSPDGLNASVTATLALLALILPLALHPSRRAAR